MTGLGTILFLGSAVCSSAPAAGAPAGAAGMLKITPSEIRQGLSYHGSDITVIAASPEAGDLVLRCLGPAEDLRLRRKARAWGFWMNVGEVEFEKAPALCLVMTSPGLPLEEASELGCRTLAGQGRREAADDELVSQLMKLKESEGLYSARTGGVEGLGSHGSGGSLVRAVFRLPAKAPPAEYRIELFGRRDGRFTLLGAEPFTVRRSGIPAYLTLLLERHPLLYGCFAVLFACAAGLAVGFIFGKGRH
ncbi:MAG: TIGR02186 family protein [Elusimicrobiota bacterium]